MSFLRCGDCGKDVDCEDVYICYNCGSYLCPNCAKTSMSICPHCFDNMFKLC